MQVQTRGEFGGLGIEVTMENGLVRVVSPIDGTPAARAGLQPGDLITHLDGEAVTELSLNEAVDMMRGRPGTDITLTIRRGDQEPFDVTITRQTITLESVRTDVYGNVGYIRITTFNEQAQTGVQDAVEQFQSDLGDDLAGIVLDLRNNPGGLLEQAVGVSDAFLKQGEIVSTRGRDEGDAQRFNANSGDVSDGTRIVVLINGGSASASEIVAGALQDHGRAVIMGTQSFGKGSVQTIIPLPGNAAMRLTTARYYTPSGRSIQAKGISPDITVEPARVEYVDTSNRVRESDLQGALDTPGGRDGSGEGDAGGDGAASETGTGDQNSQTGGDPQGQGRQQDYQLLRAIDLLRGVDMFTATIAQ
jgi:carboxyl-terminal processing protease